MSTTSGRGSARLSSAAVDVSRTSRSGSRAAYAHMPSNSAGSSQITATSIMLITVPRPLAHVVTIHEMSRITGHSRFTGRGIKQKTIGRVRPDSGWPRARRPAASTSRSQPSWAPLRDVQRIVVDDEARLERDVLGSGEFQRDGLAGEAGQAEGVLGVAGVVVEVGVGRQRRKDSSARVEDLDLEGVERGARGRLGGVDVQPEARTSLSCTSTRCSRPATRVGVGGAVAVEPGVPASGVRRLGALSC